ncbi:MAG: DUF3866 family protein [Clostridiaceae bacterium]|jgi:hypothetical protein|nr:DUF3866 family protein [Clostridiaceae bacterium]
MIDIFKAQVREIFYRDTYISKFRIERDSKLYECINYNSLTGEVGVNDTVLLNTTAVELGLGSGGYHYVLANISKGSFSSIGEGHIIKLRYTPMQINCLVAEAQESPYHEVFNSFESLEGLPVISGTLHSMLAPIALTLKYIVKKERIVYIMTDGGALPLWMSETVKRLRGRGVLHGTITFGNAFGGDLECINVYTALIAAKEILKADAIVISMGPGIAGTDTRYGFSSIEQGYIIDAVNNLKGKAIAVPRISFADSRSRHYGLSHHSRMTLGKLCCTKAFIALPTLEKSKADLIRRQLAESGIMSKHQLSFPDSTKVEKLLKEEESQLEKMGKNFSQDKEYFITCGLSALLTSA